MLIFVFASSLGVPWWGGVCFVLVFFNVTKLPTQDN